MRARNTRQQRDKDAEPRHRPIPPARATMVAPSSPGSMSPQAVVALQRSAGNAAVAQLLEQRQDCAGHQHEHQPPVQRSAAHEVLRSPGRPLDEPVRAEMEARLDADFSDVRMHDDAVAQRSTVELGARAWTSGNHIAVGPEGIDPHTLAHELTHVIQQRSGAVEGTEGPDGVRVSHPGDRFERAAEANAARVMSAPLPEVQRAPEDDRTIVAPPGGDAAIRLQPARYVTGPTTHDPDSDNYDSRNDDLDTDYENRRTPPTDESTVRQG